MLMSLEDYSKKVMAEEIAKRLAETEDLLLQILARLPMKSIMRFRAVCKRWKEMFQSLEFRQLVSTLPVSSAPAFLIVQQVQRLWLSNAARSNLWISTASSYKFHGLSLDFLPSRVFVVAGCKNLLCCRGVKNKIFICNPVTKTWIQLPELAVEHKWFNFISLAFDTRAICCTLLIGRNSTALNKTVVGMYDSKSNKWTHSEIPAGNLIRPRGEGVYSNGKYYWLNDVHDRESLSIVTLDVQQRLWNTIKGPPLRATSLVFSKSWRTLVAVIGFEGQILLFCEGLWKLNAEEAGGDKWSKTFGNMGVVDCGNCNAFNESSCVLTFEPVKGVVKVQSEQGKLLQKFWFWDLLDLLPSRLSVCTFPFSVRAFQVNNIWWP